jgi:hypothetical protein
VVEYLRTGCIATSHRDLQSHGYIRWLPPAIQCLCPWRDPCSLGETRAGAPVQPVADLQWANGLHQLHLRLQGSHRLHLLQCRLPDSSGG